MAAPKANYRVYWCFLLPYANIELLHLTAKNCAFKKVSVESCFFVNYFLVSVEKSICRHNRGYIPVPWIGFDNEKQAE